MNADTLVLNKNYAAIHVADWKKSLSLLYQGAAEAVDDDCRAYGFEDWVELSKAMVDSPSGFVHTPTMRIAVPEVIRLTRYDRLPQSDVKLTRRTIYGHYGYSCAYCGERKGTKDLNIDHVIPRSRGGTTAWENVVLSCVECNKRKADKSPGEAGMKLLVNPTKPKWRGHADMIIKLPIKVKDSWSHFIDKAYWESELR